MKNLFAFCFLIFSLNVLAQLPGDTIVVQTFNYTQTHGGGIRDTIIDFPDNPELTYEKVIMLYNMRCKDGLVSTTSDRNKGCGEWDYSCNTYIHDSSMVDSVLSYMNSHTISNFSGDTYFYVEDPTYDFYQYRQKDVEITGTNSEFLGTVGSGTLSLTHVIDAQQNSGKSQYLYTQSELIAAGITAGDIDAILLDVTSGNANADFLKVRIKETDKTVLSSTDPDLDGFTEVYFFDNSFTAGTKRLQFYTPFTWNGTANLIVEFVFTNNTSSNQLQIEGENTGIVSGLYTQNGFSLNNVLGEIEIPTDPFTSISDEITISFWSYGNEKFQPANTSFVHGLDSNGNRSVNIHLPWSNGSIYFDCGNEGGSYDRINKAAAQEEYKGQWNHWSVSKNANSGDMKIYLNGNLWHSGTEKTRLIDIQNFIIGSRQGGKYYYYGKIDEVRIWDTELTETQIQDWMYKTVDASHPNYANLVAYYKIDEGTGDITQDASIHAKTGTINGFMNWLFDRGEHLNRGFMETDERPNITFAQGDYNLNITDVIVTDSVENIPNIVKEYEIIPRYGTLQNDSINLVATSEFWEAVYEITYDPEGIAIDSVELVPTDSIEISELTYYKRSPMKYEIMSFVTPYGIWLDFGMEGKTWAVDVTDYTPIFSGTKRMTIERGGQRQEDMDIKFLFIVGTPPQDVLRVQNLWRADAVGYTSIIADRAFEARDVAMHQDGERFKIRSVITGHGQQGEFIRRHHFLNINGNEEFNWILWTECSGNPIYPQGGTWIYDRAGWCPGQGSDLYEYDITSLVTPGGTDNIDYGLENASGDSRYIVNNQLVTYGSPNFSLDAAVVQVLKPNSADAKNDRFNPACSYPEIVIQNTGSTTLTSLDIEYYEEGGESEIFNWTGTLEFMEIDTLILPINDITFWIATSNIFVAEVSNPNGGEDEYAFNNTYTTHFEGVDVYPENEILNLVCKTNNYGWQTNYAIYYENGDLFLEWDNLDDNTIYEAPLIYQPGCYQIRINDKANDGLEFWANPNQGVGYFKLKDNTGNTLYTFEPDFGGFAVYEFGIGAITSTDEIAKPIAVAVYPNPVQDYLNIRLSGDVSEKINISVFNTMGTVLLEKDYAADSDNFNTLLNMNNFPSGVYMLQIRSGAKVVTKKIIKK